MVQFSPEARKPNRKEAPMGANPVAALKVEKAVKRQDAEILSIWGKRGGDASAKSKKEKKDRKAAFDTLTEEKKTLDALRLAESNNERDVPIDDSPTGNIYTKPENRHPDIHP